VPHKERTLAQAAALAKERGANAPGIGTLPDPVAGPSFDVMNAPVLRGFPQLVTSLGGDPAALLRPFGIDPAACEHGSAVNCRQWLAILAQAAQQLNAPSFGMMLANRQGGPEIYGLLGQAMRNTRTFGEALQYVVEHTVAHSASARIWLGQTASGSHVFVGHDILVDAPCDRSQAIEQIMLAGVIGARFLTGDKASARRIHFRHAPRAPMAVYRQFFGCEVRFCQNENGTAYAASALDSPIVDADRNAFLAIAAEIERRYGQQHPPFHAQVRGVVMQLLATGQCRNEDVAQALQLHPRTLLRRLQAEGATFQRIKDEVRRDFMLYYLRETDLDLSRISEMLGFTEQSVMSRFARNWLGTCPRALRARFRSEGGVRLALAATAGHNEGGRELHA